MGYLPRIVDIEIRELLQDLAAVSIDGPRAVGKTETSLQLAETVRSLDHPAEFALCTADYDRITTGDKPILIDEWQRLPAAWDLVRRAVDKDPSPNQYILTGSAAPHEAPTHSGAGRIVPIRMRPMSLVERAIQKPSVSLAELLGGQKPKLLGETKVALDDYIHEIVSSGFPAVRGNRPRTIRTQLAGYISRIVEHDFELAGHNVRNVAALRAWLAAYAAATSTTASFATIRDAASVGEVDKPSRSATAPFRDTLERLWIIDALPAWTTRKNYLKRLGKSPVHHLADPALAATLLGLDADALNSPKNAAALGALFESLVTLSLRTYAQANEARVSHLRTHNGNREVDLIVERRDGKVVAIEVKLTEVPTDSDVRHLHWLKNEIGSDLLDAAVITTGPYAYRRSDGIAVIPAALLGP